MDIKQLRIFAAVAQYLSFTKAAIALDFSQSHVTTQVRRLEAQTGTTLFERGGRGVRLTESGRVLLSYARRIESLVGEAQTALSSTAASRSLSVAAHESLAIRWLPELMVHLRQKDPGLDVRVMMIEGQRISGAVQEGFVDVALLYSVARHSARCQRDRTNAGAPRARMFAGFSTGAKRPPECFRRAEP